MEKSLNLIMQEFEDGLIAYVNSSPVPVKVKSIILNEVADVFRKANISAVTQERAKLKAEETKDE